MRAIGELGTGQKCAELSKEIKGTETQGVRLRLRSSQGVHWAEVASGRGKAQKPRPLGAPPFSPGQTSPGSPGEQIVERVAGLDPDRMKVAGGGFDRDMAHQLAEGRNIFRRIINPAFYRR